ncbi:MAG: SGNH/GDSL hydrolase family protein, partial [Acetobacteraceae bacterium]
MRLLAFSVLCVLVAAAPGARAAPACPAAPRQALALPHLKAALAAQRPLVIVALGSSSTAGAMATDPADSYPAELQDLLIHALPAAEVSVLNRGINGQDAAREDGRIGRDVLAVRPQLVIWQVGANAAARNEDPARFRALVARGLARLERAGVDIVLMDNQRSRWLLDSPDDARINAALAALADPPRVNLFSRDRLMRAWAAGGRPLA